MNYETLEEKLNLLESDSKDRAKIIKEGIDTEIDTMKIFKEKVQMVRIYLSIYIN